MNDDDFALTKDERNAGVDELLRGRGRRYTKPKSSWRPESGHGSKWSHKQKIKVTKLFNEGISVVDIAKRLNRTPHAIAWQLYLQEEISEVERNKFKKDSEYDISKTILLKIKQEYNQRPDVIEKRKQRQVEQKKRKAKETQEEFFRVLGTLFTVLMFLITFVMYIFG